MAGAGGIFGYGLGNFMKYLQDARNHQDALAMEKRKQDEAEREGAATRFSKYGMTDVNPDDQEQTEAQYAVQHQPAAGIIHQGGGLLSGDFKEGFTPAPTQGTMPYAADQTSNRTPQGLMSMPGMPPQEQMGPPAPGQTSMPNAMPDREQMGPPQGLMDIPDRTIPDVRTTPINEGTTGAAESAPSRTPQSESALPDMSAYNQKPPQIPGVVQSGKYSFQLSPEAQAERQLKQTQLKSQMDDFDPTSHKSEIARQIAQNLANTNVDFANMLRSSYAQMVGMDPASPAIQKLIATNLIPKDMTFAQFKEMSAAGLNPTTPGSSGAGGMKDLIAQTNKKIDQGIAKQRADAMTAGVGVRKGQLQSTWTGQAKDAFNNIMDNGMVNNLKNQINALSTGFDRIKDGIKNGNLTPQDIHGYVMEQTKALTQTGVPSDSKFHAEDYDALSMDLAKNISQELGEIKGDSVPQPFVDKIVSNYYQLDKSLKSHLKERALALKNPAYYQPGVDPKPGIAQDDAVNKLVNQTQFTKPISKGLLNIDKNNQNGTVKIKDGNGNVFRIPSKNLNEAIHRGAEQVQ